VDSVFSEPQFYPSQSHLHPTLSPCWKHSMFLCRRSRTPLQDVGVTGWNVFPGSQPLLSITIRPSSPSSETHSNFCVASSILIVSSGVNCWKHPPGRHRERTHTPVLHALHWWFIPSEVTMSADETNQPNVAWDCGEEVVRLTSRQ